MLVLVPNQKKKSLLQAIKGIPTSFLKLRIRASRVDTQKIKNVEEDVFPA